jgi:large subunit ribosomal protein L27
MSKIKAGGTAKNVHDSPGQRLGVKISGGSSAKTGQIIVRQIGMTKRAGAGTFMSSNYSIHASRNGVVKFKKRRIKTFSGRSQPRTEVIVE